MFCLLMLVFFGFQGPDNLEPVSRGGGIVRKLLSCMPCILVGTLFAVIVSGPVWLPEVVKSRGGLFVDWLTGLRELCWAVQDPDALFPSSESSSEEIDKTLVLRRSEFDMKLVLVCLDPFVLRLELLVKLFVSHCADARLALIFAQEN